MSESLVARAEPAPKRELSALQRQAARAYGHGMTRSQIGKALVDGLAPPDGRSMERRLRAARSRLRSWERNQKFRDHVYDHAITNVDMAAPAILNGIVGRAKRGRVDAARLALEITGRHNPKGEQNAPQVVIAIDGIARPSVGPVQIADAEVIEGEAVER